MQFNKWSTASSNKLHGLRQYKSYWKPNVPEKLCMESYCLAQLILRNETGSNNCFLLQRNLILASDAILNVHFILYKHDAWKKVQTHKNIWYKMVVAENTYVAYWEWQQHLGKIVLKGNAVLKQFSKTICLGGVGKQPMSSRLSLHKTFR